MQKRDAGDVAVIDVEGRLTHTSGNQLRQTIVTLIADGHRQLVLNLQGVAYIDSAGLGELVEAYTTLKARGGTLKLLHVHDRVHRPLAVTGMLTFLDAFESEADAVASFEAASSVEHGSCRLVPAVATAGRS